MLIKSYIWGYFIEIREASWGQNFACDDELARGLLWSRISLIGRRSGHAWLSLAGQIHDVSSHSRLVATKILCWIRMLESVAILAAAIIFSCHLVELRCVSWIAALGRHPGSTLRCRNQCFIATSAICWCWAVKGIHEATSDTKLAGALPLPLPTRRSIASATRI